MGKLSQLIWRLRGRSINDFVLEMAFGPAFHPASRLAIGIAGPSELEFSVSREAQALVFRCSLCAEVLERLKEVCLRSLRCYDNTWNEIGLDGITVSGRFASAGFAIRTFDMWSPSPGSPAHALVAAALECLPLDSVSGDMEAYLEWLRTYFQLGSPVRVLPGPPLCLRLSCSLSPEKNEELRRIMTSLPSEGDLTVDMTNLRHLNPEALAMLRPLARRELPVRWLVSLESFGIAEALVVPPEQIADYADLKRRHTEESLLLKKERERALALEREREKDFSNRLDQARQKAIRMGMARADNVDRVIYELSADEFRRHFAEFHLSRAFFKRR